MLGLLFALQVAVAQPAPSLIPVIQPSGRIDKVLKKGDGRSQQTAYKVKSVREEYEILRVFGLKPGSQSLVTGSDKKPYDIIEVTDPNTGQKLELWFDISSFFGAGF
jgi:hypothetical protein